MNATMAELEKWFQVEGLEVDRLLSKWRWLCPATMSLLARNVYGELFLRDKDGAVFWLNTTTGRLMKVADTQAEFAEIAKTNPKRQEWFVEQEAAAYADLGLIPGLQQCIGFGIPAVFAEGGTSKTAYVADIYEHASFLGDIHRQMSELPEGSKVQFRIEP